MDVHTKLHAHVQHYIRRMCYVAYRSSSLSFTPQGAALSSHQYSAAVMSGQGMGSAHVVVPDLLLSNECSVPDGLIAGFWY